MTILFLGDLVGKPGRDIALSLVPELRAELQPDLVIANAENAAGGLGITAPLAEALLGGGIDVLTLGNHAFAKRDGIEELLKDPRILRPANYPPGTPGRGWGVFRTKSGHLVGVANFLGRALMDPVDDPFRAADAFLAEVRPQTPILFIDFHAEATSEKIAFGWHCDGRVSAVVGTHTHVQTADERVLPGGCAYLTDAGMCGVTDSVIGMERESALMRFTTGLPHRFQVAEGRARLCGAWIDLDEATGKARKITRIVREE
jgi:2',3'-cyclic-nucleotide 2'-phosphodiesterase